MHSEKPEENGRPPEGGGAPRPGVKRCPCCMRVRPASKFGENRLTEDGLAIVCLDCAREIFRRGRRLWP